jgi:hypothetical protein
VEYFDLGSTRIILLKKCASSSLRAMLQHRRRGTRPAPSHYAITFVRDPYARLVSGWADLVNRCKHDFAIPAMPRIGDESVFELWAREIIKRDDKELDHHFRPQHVELLRALDMADLSPDCQLILCKVERLAEHLPLIHKYVGGEPFDVIEHRRQSQHRKIDTYYVDDDLRARVHARFMRDEMLHHKIGDDPYFTPADEDPRDHLKALLHMG